MKHLIWTPVRAMRLEDLSELQKQAVVEDVKKKWTDWKGTRQNLELLWQEIDRHVEQFDPVHTPQQVADVGTQLQTPYGFGSKLKMVNVYTHREGIVAAMMRNLMKNDYDFFDAVPFDSVDSDIVLALKYYIMEMFEECDLEGQFTPLVRDCVQYGTAFGSYEWHRLEATRWKRDFLEDPITGDQILVDYESSERLYDAPLLTPLDVYFTVIDPSVHPRDGQIIYKKAVTPADMVANQAYVGVDKSFADSAPNFMDGQDTADLLTRENSRQGGLVNLTDAYQGKKEVLETWGDLTDGTNVFRNYVAEVVGDRLVRFEPNPYNTARKPFIAPRYCPETNRAYGRSPIATICGIQAAFDTAINQYFDYWNMEINRPILIQSGNIVRNNRIDKDKLPPISKDKAWTVRSVEGVKRMEWGARGRPIEPDKILNLLNEQMQMATGDNELNSGGAIDPYVKTGFAAMVGDAGSSRFALYSKSIEKEAIIPILDMTVDYLRQMATAPKSFRRKDVPSQEEITFNPADLTYRVRFTLRGASYNATKQVRLQMLQQFLTLLASNPITAPLINWVRAIVVIGELLDIRNVRELLSPNAQQVMDQMPRQPGFFEGVKNLFMGGRVNNANPGQQFSNGLAAASGGAVEGSNQQSPFTPVG